MKDNVIIICSNSITFGTRAITKAKREGTIDRDQKITITLPEGYSRQFCQNLEDFALSSA